MATQELPTENYDTNRPTANDGEATQNTCNVQEDNAIGENSRMG